MDTPIYIYTWIYRNSNIHISVYIHAHVGRKKATLKNVLNPRLHTIVGWSSETIAHILQTFGILICVEAQVKFGVVAFCTHVKQKYQKGNAQKWFWARTAPKETGIKSQKCTAYRYFTHWFAWWPSYDFKCLLFPVHIHVDMFIWRHINLIVHIHPFIFAKTRKENIQKRKHSEMYLGHDCTTTLAGILSQYGLFKFSMSARVLGSSGCSKCTSRDNQPLFAAVWVAMSATGV